MVIASIPNNDDNTVLLVEETNIAESNSDVVISFSNGPTNGQSLTGVYTLSFSFSGTGTVSSLDVEISDDAFKPIEAIINSMTPIERANPDIINGTRRKRLAKGSGTDIQQVNNLLKQFNEMRKMMKKMNKMSSRGLANLFGG